MCMKVFLFYDRVIKRQLFGFNKKTTAPVQRYPKSFGGDHTDKVQILKLVCSIETLFLVEISSIMSYLQIETLYFLIVSSSDIFDDSCNSDKCMALPSPCKKDYFTYDSVLRSTIKLNSVDGRDKTR